MSKISSVNCINVYEHGLSGINSTSLRLFLKSLNHFNLKNNNGYCDNPMTIVHNSNLMRTSCDGKLWLN